jgi:signal transduction histidine kinase/Zn-finger nucleic acid-binding protein
VWTTVSIAIIATLLAILVGTMLIHTIVGPLSALSETAGRIADGELGLTAPVKRDDEIGKLATSFNRMTGRLHEVAAGEERRRLARDLHDAVSQSLFSVSLIAEVLPRIYEKDPVAGRERLEELRQLTRGALAEMRMLLLELRPAALAETSLPDLLQQLGEAVIGRARIPVDLELDEPPGSGSPDVNVALYRIAQEALNNVVKHSGASRARVMLTVSRAEREQALSLVIADDGCGFDPDDVRAGRLGLGIMAERAESIGAHLDIDSAPGEGTRVTVVWASGTRRADRVKASTRDCPGASMGMPWTDQSPAHEQEEQPMKCPVCDVDLQMSERQGIEIDYCPTCRGVWLDRGELDKIIERTNAEFGSAPREREEAPRRDERPQYREEHRHYDERDHHDEHKSKKRKKPTSFLGDIFDI